MFNWFRKKKKKKIVEEVAKEYVENTLSAKELATKQDEPWVDITSFDIDPDNLNEGSFELDWNDKFLSNLIRAGYRVKESDTDADIVERWFNNVCRNVVLETYEQYNAAIEDSRIIKKKNIGDGYSEVS